MFFSKGMISIFILILLTSSVYAQKGKGNREGGSTQKENSFQSGRRVATTEVDYSGVVTDVNGIPLKGVIIRTVGSKRTVETDQNGKFSILVESDAAINVLLNGYEPRFFNKIDALQRIVLNKLSPSLINDLDEVVNIAFGKTTKWNLYSDVSYLNTKDFKEHDYNQSLGDALSSRTAGVLSLSSIRGMGDALVVVDGIPRSSSYLNMIEVDQITVLKGANAAVLYGEDARNGVILITTKRGKANQKLVTASVEYGISKPVELPKYLNSSQYMSLFNEALLNDGKPARFSQQTIDATIAGTNIYQYPSTDYYSNQFIRESAPKVQALTEFSGGNDDARFYVNLGFLNTRDIVKISDNRENVFNLRANVDFRINSFMTANLDAVGYLQRVKSPNLDFFGDYTYKLRPYLYPPLIPLDLVIDQNKANLSNPFLIDGQYLLGGNSTNLINPYGDANFSGNNNLTRQNFQLNNGINFDLGKIITKGLSARTYLSFDFQNYNVDKNARAYAVYAPTYIANGSGIDSISVVELGRNTKEETRTISSSNFYRNLGYFATLDYNRKFNKNEVSATALAYSHKKSTQGEIQNDVSHHLGFRVDYIYNDKYLADFSGAYVSSNKLADGNRGGLSPTGALGWIISKESFFSSKSIDFLKLNISGGVIKSTTNYGDYFNAYYQYEDNFETSGNGNFAWGDGAISQNRTGNIVAFAVLGNPLLTFAKRTELNLGFQANLFKNTLGLEFNYFSNKFSDLPANVKTIYPAYYGASLPLVNFESNKIQGIDASIALSESFGKFKVQTGLNLNYITSERLVVDESYPNAYQNRQGKSLGSIFGLQALGLFKDAAEIAASPVQNFGATRPGDIKYKDQNGDNIIDGNDEVAIGNSQPKFLYGLDLTLSYKNFSLFVLGSGQQDAQTLNNSRYYWISGEDKYSEEVLNRWTPATAETATFPSLSSTKSQNNFRSSSYWLRDNNFFKIQRVQLTYSLPKSLTSKFKMAGLSIYGRGNNLTTISRNQHDIDLRTGGTAPTPLLRSFSLGAIASF
jgi:TonB-linked SusC/RagA family outer membrane protein